MSKIPRVKLFVSSSTSLRFLLRGITRYANMHGPWYFDVNPSSFQSPKGFKKIEIRHLNADGIIIIENYFSPKETRDIVNDLIDNNIAAAIKSNIKIDKQAPRLIKIDSDNHAIGKMAAEHLLNRGFKNFAYYGFEPLWSRERGEGFRQKIAEAGFQTNIYAPPKSRIRRNWQQEQNFMNQWLNSLPIPIGLMACDDDYARQVIEACKLTSLNVPEDIAVVGVENEEMICELTNPPLSSISRNFERAGYEVAESLDKLMAGEKLEKRTVTIKSTHVVTRQSTDILAIDDPEVAKAVTFIRENTKDNLRVEDVIEATTASRRVLEKRFRKTLGRSILHEIKRVRIDRVTRMLIDTEMNLSQIAEYFRIQNPSRFFREQVGMTVKQYKERYGK